MSDSIQDRVLKVIATTRRLPLESVTPDSTFEELGVDSLDRLNILFDLEGEFDIEIDDEEAKKVTNIHEMVAGIQQLVDVKAAKADAPSLPTPDPLAATQSAPNVSLDPAILPSPLSSPIHDPSETED